MFNFSLKPKVNNRKKEMPVHLEFGPELFLHLTAQQLVEDDEEVYEGTSGPGSIHDIWKKFELSGSTPLTPPLSPSRQTSGAASPACLTSTAADTLQCVSDILDLDNCRTMFAEHSSCTNLTSKLIQDCMWGSHSLQEKAHRGKRIENVYDTPCSTPPSFYAIDYVSGECVDPTSVFPYHINNQEFPSGESSSEDEIDVVSIIEKPVKRKCPLPCNNNNNMSKTLRHFDQPAAKRPKMNQKRPRENANKDSRESNPETDDDPPSPVSGKEKFEDPECKRNVHNVLERKRRNDLKYSFQVLRDSIPDLKGSERAPKVSILRKATDCILNLRTEQERLLEQKSILERTHQSLKQKLKALTESS